MNRAYPSAPVCAVGGIVFRESSVLLVQRAKPPAEGQWSIPGGVVRLGETLEDAVERELMEEVLLKVRPIRVGKVVDRIFRDPTGQVSYHYIIIDYICEIIEGLPTPGSDAIAADFFEIRKLHSLDMTEGTAEVICEVYQHSRE